MFTKIKKKICFKIIKLYLNQIKKDKKSNALCVTRTYTNILCSLRMCMTDKN